MRLGWKYVVEATRFGEDADFADQNVICLRRVSLAGSDKGLEAQTGFFL
jgi:hypothetical protein